MTTARNPPEDYHGGLPGQNTFEGCWSVKKIGVVREEEDHHNDQDKVEAKWKECLGDVPRVSRLRGLHRVTFLHYTPEALVINCRVSRSGKRATIRPFINRKRSLGLISSIPMNNRIAAPARYCNTCGFSLGPNVQSASGPLHSVDDGISLQPRRAPLLCLRITSPADQGC